MLPLSEKLLGLRLGTTEELPDDLQTTLERKPDLLKRVTNVFVNGGQDSGSYILHIEFQTKDEKMMVDRMLFYYAMLWEKYREPIKQFVVFIGQHKPRMATELIHAALDYRFSLVNIQSVNYRDLLDGASQPEEAVLAILSSFKKSEADKVIPEVLRKLQQLADDERKLRRYVRQIEILANLRKLQPQVIKHTKTMALTYDIKTDVRYQQGKEEEKEEMIVALLKSKLLTDQQIAEVTDSSLAWIQQIRKKALTKE